MNQPKPALSREFALVRVTTERQEEALSVAGAWSARLIELRDGYFTAELTTTPERLSQFLTAIAEQGEVVAVRSGPISLG